MSVFSTYSTCKCLDVCHSFLGNSKRRSKEDTVEIEKIVQKLKNYIVLLWPVCHFRSLWCSQLVSVSIEEGNKLKETLKKNWCTKGYQVQNKYEFEHNFNQSGLFSIALCIIRIFIFSIVPLPMKCLKTGWLKMLNTHRFYIENYIIVRQVYLELNNFLA